MTVPSLGLHIIRYFIREFVNFSNINRLAHRALEINGYTIQAATFYNFQNQSCFIKLNDFYGRCSFLLI